MEIKLGVCNHILPGDGVFAPRFVAETGLDGMSLEFGNYDRGFPLSARRLQDAYLEAAARYHIAYPNIGMSGFDFIPFHAHRGHAMYGVAREAVDSAIAAAAYMRIPMVFIPTFGVSEIQTEDQFRNAAVLFQYACDVAADKGITIAAENVMNAEGQLRLVEQVNRENFGLFYDNDNFYHERGYDPVEMLAAMYPYMVDQLHVKDGGNGMLASRLLGTGESRFSDVIEFLKLKEYSGWIITENLYNRAPMNKLYEDPFEALHKDVQTLKVTFTGWQEETV